MHIPCCLLLAFATLGADSDDAVKNERKALAGGWSVVSAERDGLPILDGEARKLRIYFGEERLTLKQGEKGKEMSYVPHPDTKPRSIDLMATDGPFKDKLMPGIYELKGDNLKICYPFKEGATRPTEFSTSKDSGLLLLVLKKEKP